MYKELTEEILIYVLCVLAYVLLLRVIFQYYETIKLELYKPDKILLQLLHTGELIFLFLFSPIFTLKQFVSIGKQTAKMQAIYIRLKTSLNIRFFLKIIIKVFILLSIFHIISVLSTRNNVFFSYHSSFVMLFMLFVFSLFMVSYTSFLIVISRNLCFSIAVTYLTIIGILGCVFFISPFLDLVGNPTHIIDLTLDINPMLAIASLLNFDLLRWGPFYETAQIGMFRFNYPHWGVHVVSYLTLSLLLFAGTFTLNRFKHKSFLMDLNHF